MRHVVMASRAPSRKTAGKAASNQEMFVSLCRMGNKRGIKRENNDDQPCYLTSIALFVEVQSKTLIKRALQRQSQLELVVHQHIIFVRWDFNFHQWFQRRKCIVSVRT